MENSREVLKNIKNRTITGSQFSLTWQHADQTMCFLTDFFIELDASVIKIDKAYYI